MAFFTPHAGIWLLEGERERTGEERREASLRVALEILDGQDGNAATIDAVVRRLGEWGR